MIDFKYDFENYIGELIMIKPKKLQKGDKIAIVSLSSGIMGEDFCRHELEIALNRLRGYD